MKKVNRNLIIGEIILAVLLALFAVWDIGAQEGDLSSFFIVISMLLGFYMYRYITQLFYNQSTQFIKKYINIFLHSALFIAILIILTAIRIHEFKVLSDILLMQIIYFFVAIQFFLMDKLQKNKRIVLESVFIILMILESYYGRIIQDYELIRIAILAPIIPLVLCGVAMLVIKKSVSQSFD